MGWGRGVWVETGLPITIGLAMVLSRYDADRR